MNVRHTKANVTVLVGSDVDWSDINFCKLAATTIRSLLSTNPAPINSCAIPSAVSIKMIYILFINGLIH